jgi:hypothetical protein
MPTTKLDFDAVREIAMKLGGVEESIIHGAPSFKAHGKLLACPALHKSAEPDSLVVRISSDEREQLIFAKPDTYYVTNHYAGYPMVLARLSRLNRKSLKDLLERSLQFSSDKISKNVRNPPAKSARKKSCTSFISTGSSTLRGS